MLIIALVLAVVSLAALVTAVVTSNELIAWVCIGSSALGVLLLIVDAIRDRHHRAPAQAVVPSDRTEVIAPVETDAAVGAAEVIQSVESGAGEYQIPEERRPEDLPAEEVVDYPDMDELERVEDHPDEVVYDEPDYDTPSDDEPVYPVPAQEAAIHTVADSDVRGDDESDDSESYTEPYYTGDSIEPSYTGDSIEPYYTGDSIEPYYTGDSIEPYYTGDSSEPSYTDDSITVIYPSEPYSGESSAGTQSYAAISAEESDTLTGSDVSYTVTYADEGSHESGGSAERRGSDSER